MRSPRVALREAFNARARRWALKRQGRDPVQLTLASRRIYILPTPSGVIFAVMVATMLAGAMNYNNNLAFALSFLLAGIGIVTIYHTHGNLAGLRVHYLGAEPVLAGDPLNVHFSLINDSRQPREEIFLDWENQPEVPGGIAATDNRSVRLALATHQRGPMRLPGLRISSRAPLGLVRAWAWIHMDAQPLVWPRPSAERVAANAGNSGKAMPGQYQRGEEDFVGLRAYQPGDSPRHIAWKRYARNGELLVRDYRSGGPEDVLWFSWDALPPGDTETQVSRLTRLVMDAFGAGQVWGLALPRQRIEPGQGRDQLHMCLHNLALVELPRGRT